MPDHAEVQSALEEVLLAVVPTLDREQITPASRFKEDLGVDSLSMIEVVIGLERRFGASIPDAELKGLGTVEDLVSRLRDDAPA